MDALIETVLPLLNGVAAEDWAVAAAVLFATLILMRSLRMMRRAARLATTAPKRAARTGPAPLDDTIPGPLVDGPDRRDIDVPARDADADRNAPPRFRDSVTGLASPAASAPAMSAPAPALAPKAEADADDVAQALAGISFTGTSLMKWQEYCLLRDIEGLLDRLGSGHRLFCHVALEEFFGPTKGKHSDTLRAAVTKAIAPFRVDFLIVDRQGYPALGLGFGRTDPVVQTVFRQADVPCLTVDAQYDWTHLEATLTRSLGARPRAMPISA